MKIAVTCYDCGGLALKTFFFSEVSVANEWREYVYPQFSSGGKRLSLPYTY